MINRTCKRSTAIILILSLLLGLFIPIFGFILPTTTPVRAATWWNEDWRYRKIINIDHTSAETNVYWQATLDTSDATKFKGDCSDLRFLNTSGQLIPYHIVSGCGTATTVIQLLFTTLPAGTQDIYLYYGNFSATDTRVPDALNNPASGITLNSTSAQSTSPGPVAYWKFDEGYGITARSSTAQSHDGTLNNNPAWQPEDTCVSGKCLQFDGVDDYISVEDENTLNPMQQISFAAWVKPSRLTTSWEFIGKKVNGTATSNQYALAISSSGCGAVTRFAFVVWIGGLERTVCGTNNSPVVGQWQYVLGKYDGSTVSVYVNGVLAGSASYSGQIDLYPGPLHLGRNNNNAGSGSYYFKGSIDEPKVYSYARSLQQIQQDYAMGMQQLAAQQSNLSNGLAGYWKMDEASWNGTTGEVKDTSSNGNHGTAVGGATTNIPSKFGTAGVFDGVDNSIQVPSSSSLDFTSNGQTSVNLWIYPTSIPSGLNGTHLISKSNTGNGWAIGMGSTGIPRAYFPGSSNCHVSGCSGNTPISANTWSMLTMTYKAGNMHFYVNGQLAKETDVVGALNNTSSAIGIVNGNAACSGWQSCSFPGSIDETRIYNRALSANEVSQLYNYAPKPVGYWNFEEGTGTTVNDRSGNGHTASFGGTGVKWDAGKIGSGGIFNGTDNYIDGSIPANDSLDNAYDVTVAGWVYPTANNQAVIFRAGLLSNERYGLFRDNNGALKLEWFNGSTFPSVNGSASKIPLNSWTYVTAVRSNSTISLYINGILDTTGVFTVAPVAAPSFGLGAAGSGGALQRFTGSIDEVKVYNYARTPQQILQDMQSSQPGKQLPIGHWKFDENQGTLAKNSGLAGTTLDSTLTNLANPATTTSGWAASGKSQSSLAFDGNDDYVVVPDSSALSPTQFTLSTWFKWDGLRGSSASFKDWASLLAKGSYSSGEFSILMHRDAATSDTSLNFYINGSNRVTWNNSSIDTNWHLLTATYDGNRASIYLDATLKATASTSVVVTDSANALSIGAGTLNNPYHWGGQLDETKIYNTALTHQDIAVDYNLAAGQKAGAISTTPTITQSGASSSKPSNSTGSQYCVPGDATACATPIAEYNFEEGTGTTVKDTSANNNSGTWVGTSSSRYSQGKQGKAGSFNGSDDYVNVGVNSAFNGTSGLSVSAWLYPTSSADGYWVGQGGVSGGWAISKNPSNGITFLSKQLDNNNAVIANTASTVPLNTWTHVTVNINVDTSVLANNTAEIFFNGVKQTVTVTQAALPVFAAAPFRIGSRGNAVTATTFFQGSIDQVRIYNYTRSSAQVAWDYNYGKPLAHYKMDECQGSKINDSSGNNLFGTLNLGVSGITTVGTCQSASTARGNGQVGRFNGALSLDGTSDYVSLPAIPALQINLTYSAWIKTPTLGAWQTLYQSGTATNFWRINLDDLGRLVFTKHQQSDYFSSKTITTGDWHHLAIVKDGDSGLNISFYIDGQKTGSASAGSVTVPSGTAYIGTTNISGGYLNGLMDDVQLFNYSLTVEQIKVLYNNGSMRWGL